jgi:hypothetical protein
MRKLTLLVTALLLLAAGSAGCRHADEMRGHIKEAGGVLRDSRAEVQKFFLHERHAMVKARQIALLPILAQRREGFDKAFMAAAKGLAQGKKISKEYEAGDKDKPAVDAWYVYARGLFQAVEDALNVLECVIPPSYGEMLDKWPPLPAEARPVGN